MISLKNAFEVCNVPYVSDSSCLSGNILIVALHYFDALQLKDLESKFNIKFLGCSVSNFSCSYRLTVSFGIYNEFVNDL